MASLSHTIVPTFPLLGALYSTMYYAFLLDKQFNDYKTKPYIKAFDALKTTNYACNVKPRNYRASFDHPNLSK